MKKFFTMCLLPPLLFLGGCKKILDVNSTRVVNEGNFWNSIEDSRAALLGIYGLTRAALADNNGHWIYGDVRLGAFKSDIREDLKAVINNNLVANYPVINDLSNWRRFYAVINAANIFLERIHEVKQKDARYIENNRVVDVAQVRFLRAFVYFYMVRIWGDIPFITSSRDGSFEDIPKSDHKAILEFVQAEMLAAAKDLPHKYSANDIQQPGLYYNAPESRWSGALVRKISAYAGLAHVAAWQAKYADVSVYTKFIVDNYAIGGSSYISTNTLTSKSGIFYDKGYNQLIGFPFTFNYQEGSFSGNIESLTLAMPMVNKSLPDIYLPKDSILSIFREGFDSRFNIDSNGVVHSEAYFNNFIGNTPVFSKIKVIQGGSSDPTFRIFSSAIVFTRLEDIILLRSEALAVLGQKNEAVDALNRARQLRYNVDYIGFPTTTYVPYQELTHGPLLQAIFNERKKELMGEGHAWYDLVRYHKILQNDPDFLQLINTGGIFWPVSNQILAQNPLLKQNSYWK